MSYKFASKLRFAFVLAAGMTLVFSASPAARAETPTIRTRLNVKYGDAPGVSNLLDIRWPADSGKPLPLIIYIHGGGWSAGDKASNPAALFVNHGYAVASINYRFSQRAIFPAQILDCKGAIRFLKAHATDYHLDPDHVGVWGESAGGHLAALLGTSASNKDLEGTVGGNLDQSSAVQAVCDGFGPTDMSQILTQADDKNVYKKHPESSPVAHLFGGVPDKNSDLVQLANPIRFITDKAPPFLILHGDQDHVVPLAQSKLLFDALAKVHNPCELVILKNVGHAGPEFRDPIITKKITAFFDHWLKPEIKANP